MQALLERGRQGLERQADVDASRAAVTGSTPEQQLAAQEGRNRSYADLVSNLAIEGARIKDQAVANYQNAQNQNYLTRLGLTDPSATIYANQAAQWSQAGSNAFLSGAALLGKGIDGTIAGKNGIVGAGVGTGTGTGTGTQTPTPNPNDYFPTGTDKDPYSKYTFG